MEKNNYYVDNWSVVTVQGTIIDEGTGEALDGAGVTSVWWGDTVPDEVEPKLKTASDGEFSLGSNGIWETRRANRG